MSLDFQAPARRRPRESIVPMINVVFLLLIFFLMTSQLSPPEPFPVDPPASEQDNTAETAPILYLSAEGEFAFEDLRGAEAISLAAARHEKDAPPLQLRADQAVLAKDVAALLKQLATAGISEIALITRAP